MTGVLSPRRLADATRQLAGGSSRAALWIGAGCGVFALALMLPFSGKAVNNIAYVLVLLPALVAAIRSPARWRAVATDCLPLLAFLALGFLLALLHPGFGGLKPALYVSLFVLAVAIVSTEGANVDRLVYSALAVLSAFMLAGSVVEWARYLVEHGDHFRTVLSGRSANPIYAGLLVVSAAVFVWVHWLEPGLGGRKLRVAFGLMLLVLVCLLAVVVFQARSALVGLLLFAAFYAFFRGYIWPMLVFTVIVAVTLGLTGLADAILARGLSYRPEIWADALQRLVAECNMWIGCGKTDELFAGQFRGSHSGYVGTLYRYGLVGALGFIAFACWYFAISIRARSRWFLVSLVGWGGMLTAMDGFIGSPDAWWMFFWFPTVAAIVESQRALRQPPVETPAGLPVRGSEG